MGISANGYCKLSGLGMFDHGWSAESVAPIVSTCLARFGPQRSMFGSNFPVDSLLPTYEELVARYEILVPSEKPIDVFWNSARRCRLEEL